MGGWMHMAIAATALLGAVATVHARETVEFGKVGWTQLHRAAEEGSVEKIDALLLGGHAVDERIAAAQEIARLKAIAERQSQATIAEIERWGASLNNAVKEALKSEGRKSVAQKEMREKKNRRLWESVARGIESFTSMIVVQLMEGATALHIAAFAGRYEAARRLIEKGADVNARTEEGMHPLDFSAMANEVQLLGLMLEHGANLEEPSTKAGLRPLHWAAYGNAVRTARELLRRGVSVNARTNDSATSMDIANTHADDAYLLRKLLKQHGGRCAKNCLQ